VQCMADGGNVADCGKQLIVGEVIGALPKDVQPMGSCILLQGKPPGDCARDFVLSKVPGDAQPLADCVAKGGDPATCAKTFALQQVPDPYKQLVQCLSDGKSAQQCATDAGAGLVNQASQAAVQKALDDLKKLNADSDDAMTRNLPGTVRNIILLAKGIHD